LTWGFRGSAAALAGVLAGAAALGAASRGSRPRRRAPASRSRSTVSSWRAACAFDVLRIPYTQIGMYCGLNTGKWYGPGIGDQWLGK
jgi:hypothetical protein